MHYRSGALMIGILFTCCFCAASCITVGRQIAFTNAFVNSDKKEVRHETREAEACAHIPLPILFAVFGGVEGYGVLAMGDASIRTALDRLNRNWKKEWEDLPGRPDLGRGWKLGMVTVERRVENYLLWGRFCTIVHGTFVKRKIISGPTGNAKPEAASAILAAKINEAVRTRTERIRGLYKQQVAAGVKFDCNVKISFLLKKDGTVDSVDVSGVCPVGFKSDIKNRVTRWRLPPGVTQSISFAVNFTHQ